MTTQYQFISNDLGEIVADIAGLGISAESSHYQIFRLPPDRLTVNGVEPTADFALKRIKPRLGRRSGSELKERLTREGVIYRYLEGNFSKYQGRIWPFARFVSVASSPEPALLIEWLTGRSHLVPRDPRVSDELAQMSMARSLYEALAILHRINNGDVTHRDVRPNNILIGERPGELSLIDFSHSLLGASSLTEVNHGPGVVVGAENWPLAPETLQGIQQQPSDVWAAAQVVLHAATGTVVDTDRPDASFLVSRGIEGRLAPILESALVRDPASRPRADQLYNALLAAQNTLPANPTTPAGIAAPPQPPTAPVSRREVGLDINELVKNAEYQLRIFEDAEIEHTQILPSISTAAETIPMPQPDAPQGPSLSPLNLSSTFWRAAVALTIMAIVILIAIRTQL